MAKTRLSAASLVERGYGQVEPNHLSAQRTAQIYAQLPAKSTITVLENGQFAKYDYAKNEVNLTGLGEWMLVFNEIKLYQEREQYDDYAMLKENGEMVPRLFKTNVGDIFTTNAVNAVYTDIELGDTLIVGADGFLVEGTTADGIMVWQVAKKYTLADGQVALKVMRIQ